MLFLTLHTPIGLLRGTATEHASPVEAPSRFSTVVLMLPPCSCLSLVSVRPFIARRGVLGNVRVGRGQHQGYEGPTLPFVRDHEPFLESVYIPHTAPYQDVRGIDVLFFCWDSLLCHMPE